MPNTTTTDTLRRRIEVSSERVETIRAALELAAVPLDRDTAYALDDLKVELNRVLSPIEKE